MDKFNLELIEKNTVNLALDEAGNIVQAAELLGISRHALKRRIVKHRIEWPRCTRQESQGTAT